MLLYSTLLSINDKLTKDNFVRLVIEWNQSSPHKSNVINGINWNGERNIKYGDEKLSLTIEEYGDKNIIAVRYEKVAEDGAIWDTDYVMNFDEMKMSIQLDRSYIEEALLTDTNFSTPHFISMLIDGGYLIDDGNLSVTNKPIIINEDNLNLLGDIVKGKIRFKLPIVYVSKTINNENPVEIGWMCSKLKGIAHVLLQDDISTNNEIKVICEEKNEYNGAIGIYYPNASAGNTKYLYRRDAGCDKLLLEKVVRNVMRYSNMQNVPGLYTWQGVRAALLSDKLVSQRDQIVEAENAKKKAEIEMDNVYTAFDDELKQLQERVDELNRTNEALRYENQGLRTKIGAVEDNPIIYLGQEDEFYPGEIKNIILAVLEEALKTNIKSNSRREHVIKDIINSNDYNDIQGQRQQKIKNILKAYDGMSKSMRQELIDLGFEITEEGKHYKLTYYGDCRYWTTLAKTPGDHRVGKNASLTIIRDML